jgi:glycosyltransferase involved in cell wall biosynthesis
MSDRPLPQDVTCMITERRPVAAHAWPQGTVPVVSVCCWAYNHELFIEQFIESALRQKTSFPVEIVVHDDASTDRTPEILKKYEKQYPNLFRNIYQTKNQFSRGGDFNAPVLGAVRGTFVALCEGDDYWTDDEKIQKQVDFLTENQHFAGVFHKGFAVDKSGKRIPFVWDLCAYQREYNQMECLTILKSGYPTAALMFRAVAYPKKVPSYFLEAGCDFCMDIMLTDFGPLGFQDFEGSAYRQHSGGIWSTLSVIQMQKTMVERYMALYRDRDLRDRYPKIRDLLLGQMDVAWWNMFEDSFSSWIRATCQVLGLGRKLPPALLVLWLTRSASPVRYKLRDLAFKKPLA